MFKNPIAMALDSADELLFAAKHDPCILPATIVPTAQGIAPAVASAPQQVSASQPVAAKALPLPAEITMITVNVFDNGTKPKPIRRFGINLQFFTQTTPFTPDKKTLAFDCCSGWNREVNAFDDWLGDYIDTHDVGTLNSEQQARLADLVEEGRSITSPSPYPVIGMPYKMQPGTTIVWDAACMLFEKHDEMKLILSMPGKKFTIDLRDVDERGQATWRGRYDPNKLWVSKQKRFTGKRS